MTETLYYPQTIETTPLPETVSEESTSSGGVRNTSVVRSPVTEVDVQFPSKVVARELISNSLDSQTKRILGSYTFGVLGAIQIGEYVNGTSGDLRITPDGITARNSAGTTTFSIDGPTGNATFLGTILAASVITGAVEVGSGSGNVVIDGANNRILINDGTNNRIILGYQSGGF